jgi:hypothetical protein
MALSFLWELNVAFVLWCWSLQVAKTLIFDDKVRDIVCGYVVKLWNRNYWKCSSDGACFSFNFDNIESYFWNITLQTYKQTVKSLQKMDSWEELMGFLTSCTFRCWLFKEGLKAVSLFVRLWALFVHSMCLLCCGVGHCKKPRLLYLMTKCNIQPVVMLSNCETETAKYITDGTCFSCNFNNIES